MQTRKVSKYRTSFTTGGICLNESVALAGNYNESKGWSLAIEDTISNFDLSAPKQKSQRRLLGELSSRLKNLNPHELTFFKNYADIAEQRLLLWLAFCRTYRLVREYVLEIVQDRYLAYRLDLSIDSFDLFFEHKAEWDDTLASTSASTRVRLRQVVFKTMREVGIISEENRIQSSYLSPQLRGLIEATSPTDLAVFPGVTIEGGLS